MRGYHLKHLHAVPNTQTGQGTDAPASHETTCLAVKKLTLLSGSAENTVNIENLESQQWGSNHQTK